VSWVKDGWVKDGWVRGRVGTAFLASSAVIFAPSAAHEVEAAHLPSGSSVSPPSIAYEVEAAHLPSGSTVSAPTVAYQVDLPFLASGSSVFPPTVVLGSGPQPVTSAFLPSGSSVFAPTLSYGVAGPFLSSGSTLFAPTLAYQVELATVGPGSVLFPPTVALGGGDQGVTTAFISSGSSLFAPALAYVVDISAVLSGSQVFPPGVSGGTSDGTSLLGTNANRQLPNRWASDVLPSGWETAKEVIQGTMDRLTDDYNRVVDIAIGMQDSVVRAGDFVRLTNTNSFNINASATNNLVTWNTVEAIASRSYDQPTNARLRFIEAGTYLVEVSLAFDGTPTVRYNGKVKLRLNGVSGYAYRGKSGYLRNLDGHTEASLRLSMPVLVAAGDYLEVLVDRETSETGSITLTSGESLFSAVRIK
jgi:hypothetical protein